jgi:hypothetical protein
MWGKYFHIVSQHFMELVGSIPNSQELSTCSYPYPDQSSPHHPIPPLQDPSWYYPPAYVLVILVVSFPLAFPPIIYTRSFYPNSCYMARPSHPSRLDYCNYTWRRVQITKLFIMQFSPFSHHFIPLRSLETVITESALYKLLTFHVPNLISIFHSLGRLSKQSVQVWGSVRFFVTSLFLW